MIFFHFMNPEPSQNLQMLIDPGTIILHMMSPLKLRSNQFYLYILAKSQSHCLSWLHNLQWTTSSLNWREEKPHTHTHTHTHTPGPELEGDSSWSLWVFGYYVLWSHQCPCIFQALINDVLQDMLDHSGLSTWMTSSSSLEHIRLVLQRINALIRLAM